jgi:hypothetical protein
VSREAWLRWARRRNSGLGVPPAGHDTNGAAQGQTTSSGGRASLDHPGACLNCSDGPHRDGAGGCTRYTVPQADNGLEV